MHPYFEWNCVQFGSAGFCVPGHYSWFVPRAEQTMPSITGPLHPHLPPLLLRLSNQLLLICNNRSPSGAYYSNPCDVIPKQCCFVLSKRRTILYLNRQGSPSPPSPPPPPSHWFHRWIPSSTTTTPPLTPATTVHGLFVGPRESISLLVFSLLSQ